MCGLSDIITADHERGPLYDHTYNKRIAEAIANKIQI